MPTCRVRMPIEQRGFTLIELLLVMVVVAIALGLASLGLNPAARQDETAEVRFAMLAEIDRVRRQARMQQATLGLALFQHGWTRYRVEPAAPRPRLVQTGTWEVPDGFALGLEVEQLPLGLRRTQAEALIMSDLHLLFAPDGTSERPWRIELQKTGDESAAYLVSDALNPPYWQQPAEVYND